MEQTFEISVTVRCKIEAETAELAGAAAQRFAGLVGGWIDGSVGNCPFDYHVQIPEAVAQPREFQFDLAPLTPDEIDALYRDL
jgi:hypothetical protein